MEDIRASNTVHAMKKMKVTSQTLLRTSSAAHTICLMLEDIAKLPKYETTIKRARFHIVFVIHIIALLH